MKLVLAVCALLFLAAPVHAHGDEPVKLTVTANSGLVFNINGFTGDNPGITLHAGDSYEITFVNADTVQHNLAIDWNGDGKADVTSQGSGSGGLSVQGEAVTLSFTVPSSASGGTYWCDPHKSAGMSGKITVEGGATKDSPGLGLLAALAAVGAAVVAAKRRL